MTRDSKERFMRRVLELAVKAEGRTSPNPMVGAVIVRNGKAIAEGYHRRAGGPHAEIAALRKAGVKARGAVLFINLEPCCHQGKTPPCTDALIASGIRKVVVGMRDPNPLVRGKGIRRLRQAGIKVETGILKPECERLNEVFIKYITTGKPFVILKSAISLDGKIATSGGDSKWITGEAARLKVHQLRDRVDAIWVGSGTVLKDNPRLTTRIAGKKGRNPVRVILDHRGRIPYKARVFSQARRDRVVYVTSRSIAKARVQRLEKAGVEVWFSREKKGTVDMPDLMGRLGKEGLSSVLIEGGAQVNASALKAGIVDKVMFFVAPLLLGGNGAVSAIGGPGVKTLKQAFRLKHFSLTSVGDDWMAEGYL